MPKMTALRTLSMMTEWKMFSVWTDYRSQTRWETGVASIMQNSEFFFFFFQIIITSFEPVGQHLPFEAVCWHFSWDLESDFWHKRRQFEFLRSTFGMNVRTSLYMLFALKVCWWFRVLKLVHPFRNLFHSATIHNPEERNNPLMRNSTFHSDCNALSSKCVKWITLNCPPLDSSKTKRTGQCCALACNPNSQIFDFHLYMWIFQAFFFFCPVFEPHCKKIILSELNRSRVTNW